MTERNNLNAQHVTGGSFPESQEMLYAQNEIRPVQFTPNFPARLQIVFITTLTLATDFGEDVGGMGQ